MRAALHAIAEEQRERYERLYGPPTLTGHLARKYGESAATDLSSPEPVEEPSVPTALPGESTQAVEAEPAPVNPAETKVLEALDGPVAEADYSRAACELASELTSAHAREWLGEVRGNQFCDWLWSVLREGATIPYQEGRLSFAYAPASKAIRQEDERQWGGAAQRLLDLVARQMGVDGVSNEHDRLDAGGAGSADSELVL